MNPSHDVFISYSSKDKAVANAVCHVLEQHSISCWIAPRDVQPGIPYPLEIMRGIENCQVMILIFTYHSNASGHVANEIDAAFRAGKIIVPLQCDETPMNKGLEYYLGPIHWLVVYPDFEQKFGELVQSVSNILGREVTSAVLSTNKEQIQKVLSPVSEPQISTNTYLKVLSNLSCRVLVDFEEKAIVEADCLYKLPLALGEYYVQFVSIDNNSDIIEKKISLLHGDVLERVDLKTVKRERQKKMEWLPYVDNRKVGFKVKETGEIMIEAKYDFAYPYSEGFARVKKNSRYGFIDMSGKIVTSCIYENVDDYSCGLARVKQNNKYGFIDQTGKLVVPCVYDYACSYSCGLACVEQYCHNYAVIDQTGKLVVPFRNGFIGSYSEGFAAVKIDGKYGSIDQLGKIVIPCIYDGLGSFSSGLARVEQNRRYGFINQTGKLVIPCIYDLAYSFSSGLAWVKQNRRYGFIDQTGKLVIPCIYDFAFSFSGSLACVRQNDKYGFINKSGDLVIPCIYDEAEGFYKGFIRVRQNYKYGFIDQNGKLIIPCILDGASQRFDGLACVSLNGKNGVIDYWGNFMEL